jgi:cell division protein FtsW
MVRQSFFKKSPGASSADYRFLLYLGILIICGLIALTSASAPLAYLKFHDSYFFVKRQILFGLLPGIVLFLFFSKIEYHRSLKWAWVVYAASLVLLCLRFVPGIGVVINGSRNWLRIAGFSFQPSELVKLGVIFILAYLLADRRRDWDDWRNTLAPVLLAISPAILLTGDVGTVSIIGMIVFAILYLLKVPFRYLSILGLAGVVAFLILVVAAPYRIQRLTTFLHPELDPQGVGYQINQAFLAVGSGGMWGLGLGQSRQKFQYLPEVNTDSVFAIVGEEMGFLVSAGLIVLILLIGWRGLKIADAAPDESGRVVVAGIMVWFMWQAFLNIGAMVGALPLTGVPLPFVSQGGSALMALMAAMGLVTNVSKSSKLD